MVLRGGLSVGGRDRRTLIREGLLELVYTAWDIEPFARDLEDFGPPFRWDEERRAVLRAELDGTFSHLLWSRARRR